MGKKLVIAEKPMLAKAILDAIPGTAKSIKAGERVFYTEKGDYLVVALAGHVLQLKEPEDYDPKYKKWTLEDLPIFFPDWAAVPAQGKGNIVKCVKSLLPQADSVIHAGDVDDEGQLIVDELLRYCGYRGKVQRLYTSDTSTAALKKRLGMLEDNAKWEPLGVSAYARSVTDKTFGINFSRLYTKLNGTLLTVGRVQTPAMGLVVARDEAIENHVARKYYALEVQAEIDGRQPYIPAEFIPTKGNPLLGEEDKVWERKGLEKVLAECREKSFPAKVSKKEETEAPPLPFNLNKLNLYCSSRWGYDPQQVMEITQSLREKYRAITYNRSDSQYLTTEQFREAPGTVSRALANLGMQIPEIDTSRKSRCFDDSKVSAHTAIIPTNEKVNVGAMTRAEQNVYKAICGHYLIQFMPGCKKRKTNLRIDCPQGTFSATSVEVIDKGFKAVIRAGSEDKAPGALSGFAAGDYRACIMDGSVTEHETTPPRRYTKATLAADMSSVAKYVQDPQIKATLIRKDDGGSDGGHQEKRPIVQHDCGNRKARHAGKHHHQGTAQLCFGQDTVQRPFHSNFARVCDDRPQGRRAAIPGSAHCKEGSGHPGYALRNVAGCDCRGSAAVRPRRFSDRHLPVGRTSSESAVQQILAGEGTTDAAQLSQQFLPERRRGMDALQRPKSRLTGCAKPLNWWYSIDPILQKIHNLSTRADFPFWRACPFNIYKQKYQKSKGDWKHEYFFDYHRGNPERV